MGLGTETLYGIPMSTLVASAAILAMVAVWAGAVLLIDMPGFFGPLITGE